MLLISDVAVIMWHLMRKYRANNSENKQKPEKNDIFFEFFSVRVLFSVI